MDIFEAIILGIVQGIAEFLPISSSGHLALFHAIFGNASKDQSNLMFDIFLHFGTMLAIFIVYFKDFMLLIKAFFGIIIDLFKGIRDFSSSTYRKLVVLILIASVPAGIIGIFFDNKIEAMAKSVEVVGIMLIITGFLLYITNRLKDGQKDISGIKWLDAIIIGIFQAFALIPGISRSGSTIFAGLLKGLEKNTVVRFSFILAFPAILGATLFKVIDTDFSKYSDMMVPSLVGMIVSMIVGFASIKLLVNIIKRSKLHYFAYYLFSLGLVSIVVGIIS